MRTIRQARLGDARAIGRVELETWRATYAGMLPDRVLLGMSLERHTANWAGCLRHRPGDVWVAQQEGHGLVGFGHCGPQRDGALAFAGEVYTLYVAPDAQNKGAGRELLLALFGRLVDCGHRSALVWVVRANPSRFFYERLGGRIAMIRPVPVGGTPVEAIGYGWKDLPAALAGHVQSRGRFTGDRSTP